MERNSLGKIVILIFVLALTSCSSMPTNTARKVVRPIPNSALALWEGNTAATWDKLQHTSLARLTALQSLTNDAKQSAWLELALISKRNSINTQDLSRELVAWRTRNPSHPANTLFPDNITLTQLSSNATPHQIALLLPQRGAFGPSGQTVREGFLNAYYANLYKVGNQSIKFYDTTQENIESVYKKAIADGADFVIGPLAKNHVQQLSSSGSFPTPTLALNYTDHSVQSLPTNFYEFGLLPEDEAAQIAERASKTGVKNAIVIAPQNAWGKRMAYAFTESWHAKGGAIQETWYYGTRANFSQEVARLLNVNPKLDKELMEEDNNKEVLEQQRRQDFDVIFLFSQPQDARIIVPLLRYYYASNIPIYGSSSIYSGKTSERKDMDLDGVIVCDIPWSRQIAQGNINDAVQADRLYAVGQDAYLLSQTLTRLVLLPNFPIYGTTGALTLSSTRQIHRRLPCTAIRNGAI